MPAIMPSIVLGMALVILGASSATSTVAAPMAMLRVSHSAGLTAARHHTVLAEVPTKRGIWLPMMMRPTPLRYPLTTV